MAVRWKGNNRPTCCGPAEAQAKNSPRLARDSNRQAVALHITRTTGDVGADIAPRILERAVADIGAVRYRSVASNSAEQRYLDSHFRQRIVGHIVPGLLHANGSRL